MNNVKQQNMMKLFNDILSKKNSNSLEDLLPETDKKGDDVDLAHVQKQEQLNLRLGQRNVLFLKKVEAAKQRILDGTYGTCEDCGANISQGRLLARPTACLCIDCQEEKERGQHNNIHFRRDLRLIKSSQVEVKTEEVVKLKKFNSVKDIGFESIVEV